MCPLIDLCYTELGYNPYDVRKKCDRERDGDLCYQQMSWIETWMNRPAVKRALGVDPARNFESCNMQVNQAFAFQGDGAHNSATLLPDLVEDGVRLLVYAGNADMMCNFIVRPRLACPCSVFAMLTAVYVVGQRALGGATGYAVPEGVCSDGGCAVGDNRVGRPCGYGAHCGRGRRDCGQCYLCDRPRGWVRRFSPVSCSMHLT